MDVRSPCLTLQHSDWTLLLCLGQYCGVLGSICSVESPLKEAGGDEWVLIHKHGFHNHISAFTHTVQNQYPYKYSAGTSM